MKTKKQSQKLTEIATGTESHSIGIDLGDRFSQFCILDGDGEVIEEGRLRTTQEAIRARFERISVLRIAMEAGTHSGWVSRLLEELGHEVVVANPRDVFGIIHCNNKNDRIDAEKLARYVRVDPKLLSPITHRSEAQQLDLAIIRMREKFVVARTMLINAARGIVKSLGHRLPGCGPDYFADRCRGVVPPQLKSVIEPLLDQIASLTRQIGVFDMEVDKLAYARYPETARRC